jgi:cytoskeletal protein CcmA (bactofilin family)
MWNKHEESNAPKSQPEPAPRNVVSMPPSTPVASAPAPSLGKAVIGASMQIQGEIRAREELLVEGDVEGVIESQSSVTIGPNGKVKANIKAREVVIYGSARGNIEVAEKIAIRDKGSLIGDIKAAGISIDDGAYFKGSIDIVRPEPVRESKSARKESAAGD